MPARDAVAISGVLISEQLTHGTLNAAALGGDALAFIGAFVTGFAAAYSNNNADA